MTKVVLIFLIFKAYLGNFLDVHTLLGMRLLLEILWYINPYYYYPKFPNPKPLTKNAQSSIHSVNGLVFLGSILLYY